MEHSGEEDINATNNMMAITNSTLETKEIKRDSPATARAASLLNVKST